ncbi:hypothetical protein ACWGJ7_41870 [Streptomyces tendae]
MLFVEVDNHTEPAATVAAKINRYRRFFQRKVKDHQGRDVELWSTVWGDSGRAGLGLDEEEKRDGWREYAGTVPVIATHLDQLPAKGPHGPVWWRFGCTTWQPLNDALTNTDTHAEYSARSDARRATQEAQYQPEVGGDPSRAGRAAGGPLAMPLMRQERRPPPH